MTGESKLRFFIGVPIALVVAGLVAWAVGLTGFAAAAVAACLGLAGVEVAASKRTGVRRSFFVDLLVPVGLGLLFVAERAIGPGHDALLHVRALAALCLFCAAAWRGYSISRATGERRVVEGRLAGALGVVLAGVGLYALSTDAGLALLGLAPAADEPSRVGGALSAAWPAVVGLGLAALLAMQSAYRAMPVDEAIEPRRISAAAETALSLGLSGVFVVAMLFVASERDVTRDLSYFRTTEPSQTSLRMVRSVGEPIEIVLFFPPVNEVLGQARPYFEALDAASSEVTVRVQDHALAPALAREHQVRGNGFVLLLRGEGEGRQAESFEIGVELDQARRRLRTLDGTFQQQFARLTTRPRELHLTAGHDEHTASGAPGDAVSARITELDAALRRANIERRELGLPQGLASDVPADARAVAVVGPRRRFMREEAESLLRYARRGGRLAVFVDPDVEHGLEPLFEGLGLRMRAGVLHSETQHARSPHVAPPADRAVIYTSQYTAHPTVTNAHRYRQQVASIFQGAGALERVEGSAAAPGVTVTFPIRTEGDVWLDADGDHARGASEVTAPRFNLLAVATLGAAQPAAAEADGEDPEEPREGRVVVVADGDFLNDAWIGNRGNAFVVMDLLGWLVGEDRVLGPTATEEDEPIVHTRDEDKLWFYGTSFGAPLPLLLIGLFLATYRRRGGRRGAPTQSGPESNGRSGRQGTEAALDAEVRAAVASSAPAPEPTSDGEPAREPEPEDGDRAGAGRDDAASGSHEEPAGEASGGSRPPPSGGDAEEAQ